MPRGDAIRPPPGAKDYSGERPVSSEPTELIPAWQAKQLASPTPPPVDEGLFDRNIQAINSQIRKAALDHKLEVVVWVSPGLERPLFDHLAGAYSACIYLLPQGQPSGFIELSWSHASPPRDGPNGPLPSPPPQQYTVEGWELFWLRRRTPRPPI